MRSGRILAAGVLALVAGTGSATPVTMSTPFVHWYSDEYVNTGNGTGIYMGDCRSLNCTGFTHGGYTVRSGTPDAPITSYHYGSLDYGMTYNQGHTDFNVHSFQEVSAGVDELYANGTAMADIRIFRFIATFQVFEPTLYTGSFDLYAGEAQYTLSHISDWIQSGSTLQAGTYSTTVSFSDWLTTGYVSGGESVYSSRHQNWSYHFSQVPEPATLPMLGLGLLIVAVARRRGRANGQVGSSMV